LVPPPELLVDSLQRVGGPRRFPLRGRKGSKGKQLVAGFFETLIHRLAAQLPFAREGAPRLLHRLAALGVNHPPVIFRQLLAQMGGSLGQQIPEFMVGAALDRELGLLGAERRGQTRVAIDHRQERSVQLAFGQRLHHLEPRALTFHSRQPEIHDFPAPISAYCQRHQHWHPYPLLPDSYQPSKNRLNSPDLDAFSLFHQLPDTTFPRRSRSKGGGLFPVGVIVAD